MTPQERHLDLDELELWRDSSGTLSVPREARRAEIASHLEQCADCSELAEAHNLMSSVSNPAPPTQICPAKDVWLQFATDLIPEPKRAMLLAHASQCVRCAAELKMALDTVGENAPEPELSQLASSTVEWQAETARYLRSINTPSTRPTPVARSPQRWWPIFAYSMAAFVLAAAAVTTWIRLHPSVDAQVARAVNSRRLTVLRIPGARAIALYSPVRGSTSSSQDWPELLEVRLRAEKALAKDSESAYWHQILGRTFVVQLDAKSAMAEFQKAKVKDPHLDRIEFDLGTAYFELGEQTRDASNYGYAAEYFSRALDREAHPDPTILFDRALCWERSGLRDLARQDLQKAYALETQPDWRKAIAEEIQSLEKNQSSASSTEHGEGGSANPPARDLQQRSERDYEAALTAIFVSSDTHPDFNLRALDQIAKDGEQFHDSWLADWLHAKQGDSHPADDASLAEAVSANRDGKAAMALAAAQRANLAYARARNRPGLARASIEEIYALQRMGRAHDCLERIHSPPLQGSLRGYSYLSTMLLLEEAACQEMAGAMERSKLAIDHARALAATEGFSALYARAQGFLAAYYTLKGAPEQGWNADASGLEYCRERECPPLREYQFVSDLIDDSESLGFGKVAVLLAGTNIVLAQRGGNIQNTAYAYEVLGQRQLESGSVLDAKASFQQADRLLKQLGDTPAARAYRADWAADRSELAAQEGKIDQALERLSSVSRDVSSAESLILQLNYWSRRALVEHRAGHTDDALASAQTAVGYANQVRQGLTTPSDRYAWRANSRVAYVLLVESLVEAHRAHDALDTWEAYQTGAEEPSRPSAARPNNYALRPGFTLIFARLLDRYVAFTLRAANSDPTVYIPPASAESIDQLARTFSLLCSDPHSRLSEVRSTGQSLYSLLLSGINHPDSEELRIEVSGGLEKLPLNALVLPDGAYLGTRHRITVLSESWTLRNRQDPAFFLASTPLLVLRTNNSGNQAGVIPASYDETSFLLRRFPHAQVLDGTGLTRDSFLQSIQSAEIFHFVGHAINEQGATRLLMAADSTMPDSFLTSAWLENASLHSPRLAVLAACSTAGGQTSAGSEIADLTNAFLRDGTQDVVASLWDVDSQATRLLMIAFYEELLKGKSASAALYTAQAALSSHEDFRHPYFWSGFRILE